MCVCSPCYTKRVVVITGGGQGLGRAYALAFAARKAKVVINDLGTVVDPKSQTPLRIADLVAEEVVKLGGQALANYDSVENAEKIIQDTIKQFGRVDVIINNAGILRDKAFHNMKPAEYKQVIKVHLKGTFLMCRCAWPYMRQQGFGRIINTSSVAGIFGNFGQANYSAAKLAIVGLTNTLAREGESKNVLVNCIAPVAATGMTKGVMASDLYNSLTVDHIVPLVEYLASPDCTQNGSLLEVGGGWVAKLRWQRTKGVSFDFPLRAEDVRDRFDEICNFESEPEYPDSGNSSVVKMFENFERNQKRLQANKTISLSRTFIRIRLQDSCPHPQLRTQGAHAEALSLRRENFLHNCVNYFLLFEDS